MTCWSGYATRSLWLGRKAISPALGGRILSDGCRTLAVVPATSLVLQNARGGVRDVTGVLRGGLPLSQWRRASLFADRVGRLPVQPQPQRDGPTPAQR